MSHSFAQLTVAQRRFLKMIYNYKGMKPNGKREERTFIALTNKSLIAKDGDRYYVTEAGLKCLGYFNLRDFHQGR